MFGVKGFFTGQCNGYCVLSDQFTTLYTIERKDFLEVLSVRDREIFQEIREDLLCRGTSEDLQVRCELCDVRGHLMQRCASLNPLLEDSLWFKRQGLQRQERSSEQNVPGSRAMRRKTQKYNFWVRDKYLKILDYIYREDKLQSSLGDLNDFFDDSQQTRHARFLLREDIQRGIHSIALCEDPYEGIEYYSEESSYEDDAEDEEGGE